MKTTILRKLSFMFILVISMAFSSCDTVLKTAGSLINSNTPLTSTEIGQGLKQALSIGIDTAVYYLNRENGYYLDQTVKLVLPPETNQLIEYARRVPGLDRKIEDFIVQINRSAEDAAGKAAPIFKDAITGMKINDAMAILNGADNAATQYLKDETYNKLVEVYKPILTESLEKPLVGGVSASQTWNGIVTQWNKFANSFAGDLLKVEPVNIKLEDYFTSKALDGLFVKVELQEKEIRNNASARVTALLKRVFSKQ